MKQYIYTLSDILANGIDHPDRTRVGRRSIFGTMMRFNLNDGFPLVTTRKIFIRGMIEELRWLVSGSTSNKPLIDKNVNIWTAWAVTEKDIEKFIESKFPNAPEEEKDNVREYCTNNLLHGIGRSYGHIFRNAPAGDHYSLTNEFSYDDLASDKKRIVDVIMADPEQFMPFENAGLTTKEEIAKNLFDSKIDQMQNLILGLKARPHSSRHIVSAWIPEYVPDETLSPQENVLIGRSALASCHVLQQYFVLPPLVEGGKMRLSLKMDQR